VRSHAVPVALVGECSSASHSTSPDRVVDEQEHHSSNDGDDETVDVQSRHTLHAEQAKQPASDHCPHNTQGDVEEEPFAPSIMLPAVVGA
jgi:hypothetical protein